MEQQHAETGGALHVSGLRHENTMPALPL